MWHEGTIGIPIKGSSKFWVAHYWVKAYEKGGKFGIDGGRISKLTLKIDGQTVINYDRGWDIKPDENDEGIMMAYSILIHDYY